MAIGARGGAIVVFTSPQGVWAASRSLHGAWQRPTFLSKGGAPPLVALDPHGNATAAVAYGAGQSIRVAFRPGGRPWRKATTIGSGTDPQLAIGAKGDALAVWTASMKSRPGYLVQSALRPALGRWRRPVTIGRGGEAYAPHVAIGARGDAVAVWARMSRPARCCPTTVQAASSSAGGRWNPAVTVHENPGMTGDTAVGLAERGAATVVWSANGVHATSRSLGRSWRSPVTIATPGARIDSLRFALDSRGDALAVWWVTPTATDRGAVQAAVRSPQGAWQPSISLGVGAPADLAGALGEDDAALDARGNAVVIWVHDLGEGESVVSASVFARRG